MHEHIAAYVEELVRIRRDIHAHPELGMTETRTAGLVAECLRKWGLEVTEGVGKFGVVGLTKNIALDHALDGIRCNCICPGRVETPFVKARLQEYPDPDKARREMSATQAIGRMAQPNEIAAAALYLASDESAFVTGTEFIIDGGMTA